MKETQKIIEIQNLVHHFSSGSNIVKALDTINVDIYQGEFFTLLGPSGCGKTTLLRSIAGFFHPNQGRILLEGKDLMGSPPYARPVNTVFQNYALFPHMTIAENVGFGLRMMGHSQLMIQNKVDEMLALVRLESMANRLINEISGGQQQRVALARALAPEPKVLLLDEPLSALDFKLRKEMQLELKRLQLETGITFVFVTHDQQEALSMSDRIAVMHQGTIRQIASPVALYQKPANRFVADFIGEMNFLPIANFETLKTAQTSLKLIFSNAQSLHVNLSPPPDQQRYCFAFRPEQARLQSVADHSALPSGLVGEIINTVYEGAEAKWLVRIHLENTHTENILLVRTHPEDSSLGLSIGSQVNITLLPKAGTLLPKEDN